MDGTRALGFLGVINWHIRVSGEHFGVHRAWFREAFRQVEECWKTGDWNLMCSYSKELREKMQAEWETTLKDETHVRKLGATPSKTTYAASDASNWGWAFLSREGEMIQHPWEAAQKEWHINTKETFAAIRAGEYFQATDTRVVLAVDNTTAVARLRGAWDMMSSWGRDIGELMDSLDGHGAELQLVQVPSASNPADAPSRGAGVEPREELWNLLERQAQRDRWWEARKKSREE